MLAGKVKKKIKTEKRKFRKVLTEGRNTIIERPAIYPGCVNPWQRIVNGMMLRGFALKSFGFSAIRVCSFLASTAFRTNTPYGVWGKGKSPLHRHSRS